jgi:biopolymer transport protein ExbD
MMTAKQGKKDLNFELNLLPVFDILSCCICFLLMTVAWIQIGSVSVNQAMGAKGKAGTETAPALWAYLNNGGDVLINVKNAKVSPQLLQGSVRSQAGQINWLEVNARIAAIHQAVPELKTALIMPMNKSSYQDIVHVMDTLKTTGISDVGISPL